MLGQMNIRPKDSVGTLAGMNQMGRGYEEAWVLPRLSHGLGSRADFGLETQSAMVHLQRFSGECAGWKARQYWAESRLMLSMQVITAVRGLRRFAPERHPPFAGLGTSEFTLQEVTRVLVERLSYSGRSWTELLQTPTGLTRQAVLHPKGASEQEVIKRLQQLLSEGVVEEARALVQDAQQRWPESLQIQKWARVLEPPKVRVLKGRRSPPRNQEYGWLRQHAREYPGQWLALLGDQLVAANADLSEVLEAVKSTGRERDVLLHFQPERVWPL